MTLTIHKIQFFRPLLVLCLLAGLAGAGSYRLLRGQTAAPSSRVLIGRGAGTSILEGGTGAPDFQPVITNVAFHVESTDGVVTGDFECLALAPRKSSGAISGEFTNNVMYVTGTVQDAKVQGDKIVLTGDSDCTGIGAGSNVPFTVEIQKGGPGATVVLRAGNPQQTFREILTSGNFEIAAVQ
jgi:hypothetical protein